MAVITHRECRRGALGHAWELLDGPDEEDRLPDTPRWRAARRLISVRCLRCGTRRYIAISARGGRLAGAYKYVDDYLMPKGEEAPSAESLRLWLAKASERRR
jgi:hypothetical protein